MAYLGIGLVLALTVVWLNFWLNWKIDGEPPPAWVDPVATIMGVVVPVTLFIYVIFRW